MIQSNSDVHGVIKTILLKQDVLILAAVFPAFRWQRLWLVEVFMSRLLSRESVWEAEQANGDLIMDYLFVDTIVLGQMVILAGCLIAFIQTYKKQDFSFLFYYFTMTLVLLVFVYQASG